MCLFHLFKKTPYIQTLFDNFFQDMVIVDVIAAIDIPVMTINGVKQRATADIFFNGYSRMRPYRIDSFRDEIDTTVWLFDSFCVLELNITHDSAKQFVVLKHTSKALEELPDKAAEAVLRIRMLQLKEVILKMQKPFELMLFKETIDFFNKHQQDAVNISKNKYY